MVWHQVNPGLIRVDPGYPQPSCVSARFCVLRYGLCVFEPQPEALGWRCAFLRFCVSGGAAGAAFLRFAFQWGASGRNAAFCVSWHPPETQPGAENKTVIRLFFSIAFVRPESSAKVHRPLEVVNLYGTCLHTTMKSCATPDRGH